MNRILVFAVVSLLTLTLYQNCSKSKNSFQDADSINVGANGTLNPKETNTSTTATSCKTPDGTDTIDFGDGGLYFNTTSCKKIELRMCQNSGTLAGSFAYNSCGLTINGGGSGMGCTNPNDSTKEFQHGESTLFFANRNICQGDIVFCQDGVLENYNPPVAGYANYCTEMGGANYTGTNRCTWEGGSVPPGGVVIGFLESRVEPDMECMFAPTQCKLIGGSPRLDRNVYLSCRKKNIFELPPGSVLAKHKQNSRKLILQYKPDPNLGNVNCQYQYVGGSGQWTNLGSSFSCNVAAAGALTYIQSEFLLNTVSGFQWGTTANGLSGINIRLHYDNDPNYQNTVNSKPSFLKCENMGAEISANDLDENCNGSW